MSTSLHIMILAVLMISPIVFDTGLSAQPSPLCPNNLHPDYHYGSDRIVATTRTQLAILRHGTTTWEYHDAPYPTRHWRDYSFGVYHANGDTVLGRLIYRAGRDDQQGHLELVRSVDEGRTWIRFYGPVWNRYHIQFVSGYTILVQSSVQDTCAAMTIDDAGNVRSCLQITTPFIEECVPAPDHTYLLCRHHYDNIENHDYGGSRLTVDRNGTLSKTLLPGFHGTASTTDGPVPYRRIVDRLILYHPGGQDTIIVPDWFITAGGIALFDTSIYAQWTLSDPESGVPLSAIHRWKIGRGKQQDVSWYPSCGDSPVVHGDTVIWCDFDGLRYRTKGSERLDSIPFPFGWVAPAEVSWIDGSLCYYLGRGERQSGVPDIYRLLAVTADDTLHRNLFILPFTSRTSCLGSKASYGGTEIRSLIHYDEPARNMQVFDITPRNGTTLRYEYEDSSAIQYWYEVGDTVWYYQAGELYMKASGHPPRSLWPLHTIISGPIVSMAYYRDGLFILTRSGYYPHDSTIVLKCSFDTDTSIRITRILAWDSPSAIAERLVPMDSCLAVSGLPDSVDYGSIDGIRFDHPAYHGVVSRQGPIACILRSLDEKGRYEICATTTGRSLTPVDTIPFHPYRTIIGAYLMNGSIAVVTNEGTWLFPSIPVGTITGTGGTDREASDPRDLHDHSPISIRLPYNVDVDPSSAYRQVGIYDITGRQIATLSIAPDATTLSLRNLNKGTYVMVIPDMDSPIVRTIIVE